MILKGVLLNKDENDTAGYHSIVFSYDVVRDYVNIGNVLKVYNHEANERNVYNGGIV